MAAHEAVEVGEHVVAHAGEDAVEHTVEHEAETAAEHGAESGACAMSFSADTLVAMADGGTRAIASLHAGDTVLAYDLHTGTVSAQPVTRVFVNHDANLVDVTLVSNDTSQAQAPATASEGEVRDAAVAAHGTRAPPSTADAAPHAETIHTTTNHPWYTADHGWLPAGFLRVGERVVRADGTTATVAAVRAVAGAAAMYDLTVGTVHTFAVGNDRYVVHNCPKGDDWGDGRRSNHRPDRDRLRGSDAKRADQNVDKVAKRLGMTPEERREFGGYIEDVKNDLSMSNDDTFSWQELLQHGRDFHGEFRGED